jgi:amidohydrolase
VKVSGPGGHTARPHLTADLVYALGKIVTELPAALSRRVDPRSSLSLVWGRISAGLAPNAIPEDGFAAGTVRCLDEEAWHQAPDLLKGLVSSVASAYGVIAELDYVRGVPPAVNDGDSVRMLGEAAELAIGPEAVAQAPQSLGGEDVAWYLESIPGALARLGIRGPQTPPDLDIHQPNFDVDERAIGVGVRLMAASALIALSAGSAPEEPVASTRGAA